MAKLAHPKIDANCKRHETQTQSRMQVGDYQHQRGKSSRPVSEKPRVDLGIDDGKRLTGSDIFGNGAKDQGSQHQRQQSNR